MPRPWLGVARNWLSTVFTGAVLVMSTVLMFCFSRSQAAPTRNRPFPCSYAPVPVRKRADELIAWRSWSGFHCTLVCFAALISSAAPPVADGAAIEVPCSSAYPAGQAYARQACPSQAGMVEIADPGATMFGLK